VTATDFPICALDAVAANRIIVKMNAVRFMWNLLPIEQGACARSRIAERESQRGV
jgi:hypothetical protein